MSFKLNPEAPEFLPANAMASIQKGFVTMSKTIRLSNNLPVGGAYKQCRSVTDFDVVAKRFCHNVVFQLNSIFVTELPSFKLKEDDFEDMERLIDANDSILDRIYNNIDCVNKGVEPNRPTDNAVIGPGGGTVVSPKITKIQVGDTTFTTARNITRPQLLFKDRIDNTSAVFVPKISEKPNNITPLKLEKILDENGHHIGFEHPYRDELAHFTPKVEWLRHSNEEPTMPPPLDETSCTFIKDKNQLDKLVEHLLSVEEIGVDLEHHSYRSYQGFTCLIQITTTAGDFIIDAIACREHLQKLNLIFTNPNILKIFHGVDSDVKWLQKDFGIYMIGVFDTFRAARQLNFSVKSFAFLLKKYCGMETDKSFQLADWRLRPLTDEMIKYARLDTHYLPYIFRRMRTDLLEAGHGDDHLLLRVFEKSKEVCGTTYNKPITDENSHMTLYQSNMAFNAQQMTALRLLYRWRDKEARMFDESTGFLLPNHMLVALAESLPRDTQGVTAVCQPMPPFVRQNLETIHKILLSCREVRLDSRFDARVTAARLEPPTLEYLVHDVQQKEDNEDNAVSEGLNGNCGLDLGTCSLQVSIGYLVANPDIKLFFMDDNSENVRHSNEVQNFLPPYLRHGNYRMLAQEEEIRDRKEKEVISNRNDTKNELLDKLEKIKVQVEKDQNIDQTGVAGPSTAQPHRPKEQKKNKLL